MVSDKHISWVPPILVYHIWCSYLGHMGRKVTYSTWEKKSQHTEKKVTCRDISVKENYVIRWSKGPKKNLKNAHLNALSTISFLMLRPLTIILTWAPSNRTMATLTCQIPKDDMLGGGGNLKGTIIVLSIFSIFKKH